MKLIEKCRSQNYIFRGKIISLRKDTVELPNGEQSFREVVEHSGGVSVLAVCENGDILFVEQFRYAIGKVILEIPAGRLETGESAKECGIRELKEETGAVAESFEPLCEFYPTVGYSSEKIYIFLAKDLKFEETKFDEGEFLNLRRISLPDALKMVQNGEIKDGKTVVALYAYSAKNIKTTF